MVLLFFFFCHIIDFKLESSTIQFRDSEAASHSQIIQFPKSAAKDSRVFLNTVLMKKRYKRPSF